MFIKKLIVIKRVTEEKYQKAFWNYTQLLISSIDLSNEIKNVQDELDLNFIKSVKKLENTHFFDDVKIMNEFRNYQI